MQFQRKVRKLAIAFVLAAPVVLIAATATAASTDHHAKVTASFASPALYKTHPAVAYDRQSVPTGSQVEVMERSNDKGGLVVTLRVWGLDPNRRYDAYVYTKRCGATPAAAGRRTQNGPNKEHFPQNEVWLNFKTNRRGDASPQVWQYWTFNPGQANSVVIQSHATGGRVACVSVPFN
jgi:Cu-Zn family superoxide dismutase